MLLKFSVSNFRSFRDLQTLELGASNYDKSLPENCIDPQFPGLKDRRWVRGVAIYGANASGKSTLLSALKALSELVENSAKRTSPEEPIDEVQPFSLDPEFAGKPTGFGVVFVANGIRYDYRVAATRERIHYESLRAYPKGKEQLWFERRWDQEKGEHHFGPENPSGLPRAKDIERRTLPNVLYLSKSIADNRGALWDVFNWLSSFLTFIDFSTGQSLGNQMTLQALQGKSEALRDVILSILRHADLGIMDAGAVDGPPMPDKFFEILEPMPQDFRDRIMGDIKSLPELKHRAPDGSAKPLPWFHESTGTQRLYSLVAPWIRFLATGRTVCVDELESSMHPLMVRELLRLFFSEEQNKDRAQIIFTTHNPLLLDTTFLRRDQIWFTDKDKGGASHLYPLTDFQPRQGESLVRGYLAGRYGGIPFVPEGLLGQYSGIESVGELEEVGRE